MKKVIAIDLGATHLRVAVINKEGEILTKKKERTKKGDSGEIVTEQIKKQISPLIDYEPKAITIGSIGPFEQGGIVNPSNLDFNEVPLKQPIEEEFDLPVKLFNDCQAAVWGEKVYGAGKNYNNLVYITISTGIGGGVIVGNHLLKGANNNAAEVGHQIIEEKYNFECNCGNFGHWEGIASGDKIPRFFRTWLKEQNKEVKFQPKDTETILSHKNNNTVEGFLKQLGKINARAVSNLIVAYNPALITFGGAVLLNHPNVILEPIKNNIDHFLKEPEMKVTPLGGDIILMGAAASYFNPPK
ncbi:MAG: ROK family protein [Candidatus Paceibacterota bacterium]